ncbi:Thymidylate kinase [compost metagenome]
MNAPFFALEGIGGSGKTSVWNKLNSWLEEHGEIPWVAVREPGGTPHAEFIRNLVNTGFPGLEEQPALDPMGVALLFNVCRVDLTNKVIRPALEAGKVVLTDRYCDTTFAYQSVFNGLDMYDLMGLHDDVISMYPNWTYLLDCPGEIATQRVSAEEKARDQFDRAGVEKQEAMRQAYLTLARRNPGRYVIIDATQSPDDVAEQVLKHMIDSIVLWKSNSVRYGHGGIRSTMVG